MKTLSIEDFAKYIGRPKKEIFALPFSEFVALIREHGFYLTGAGLVPKSYAKPKPH
jgi:hypothetical protein